MCYCGEKRIKKLSQRNLILPTLIILLFSEIVLSVLTEVGLLHYIEPSLEEQTFEAAMIHIGINHILYDSSSRKINLLFQNIKEIGKKCKNNKVKYVFISSLTFNTRISHKLLNEVNEMIERVCLENGYYYIENGNVYENDLFKDGLHLQNSGKKNFVS